MWFGVGDCAGGDVVDHKDVSVQPRLILVLRCQCVDHNTCSAIPKVNNVPLLLNFVRGILDFEDWVFV